MARSILSLPYECVVSGPGEINPHATQALIYTAQGFRRVSNRFNLLARVDRLDWREFMAKHAAPWDPEGEGREWVAALGIAAADHYRRVFSKDQKEVPREVARLVPSSNHDPVEYVPIIRVHRTPKLSNVALVDVPKGYHL